MFVPPRFILIPKQLQSETLTKVIPFFHIND